MSTITLSSIPNLTASVGVPRLAAIEYPLGYLLGLPGDKDGQLAVLASTLQALTEIKRPGEVVHLPFEFPASAKDINANPAEHPPIVKYLLRHPWHLPKLISRQVPGVNPKNPITNN